MPSLKSDEARIRAALITVMSYQVELDLTAGDLEFGSRTTIVFDCADTSATTFVDVKPRSLSSASLNGRQLNPSDLDDGRLPLSGLQSHNTVVVAAQMAYSHDGEGLHRSVDPADDKVYLHGMSFLDAAPRMFACFDQPDLKAPYAVSVRAPHDWMVIGNGAATQTAPGEWTLSTTKPLSTYFVTVVAGPYHSVFHTHDGIRLGLHTRHSLAEHLDKDAHELFTVTGQSFDAYHQLFGIRYPFGEYHQAFVPGFNAGAMENPGCVVLRDGLIFRSAVTDGERSTRARVIVHEMAHQWFGDLVTMQWWDDLWLNESFAEYMAYRVTDDVTAFHDSWVEFAFARKRWGLIADQSPSTHPIAGNGAADAASALTDFDGISYAKGAAALKQLNAYLGDEVFLAGVRSHLNDHSYANATLADLLQAWTDAGAVDLDGWAQGWLRTAGVDTLRTAQAGGSYSLSRTPPADRPARRPHSVVVRQFGVASACNPAAVTIDQDRVDLGVAPDPAHPLLLVDSRDDTWAKLRLDEASQRALPDVLPTIEDPVSRAALWLSVRDSVADADLDPRHYLALLESAMPHESEDIAVSSLLGGARKLFGRLWPGTEAMERIAAVAQRCLDAALPGTSRQVAVARAWVANTFDADRLQNWLDGSGVPERLAVDDEFRWRILLRLCVLGAVGSPVIDLELRRDHTVEGSIHAAECRAALPDADTKADAWSAITGDESLSNYELEALCEGFWQPEQMALGEPYVERYFDEMPKTAAIRSGWVVQLSVQAAFPMFAVEQRTLDLAAAVAADGSATPGVRRAVIDSADEVRRALASRVRYGVA
jgi:aminopeptidase N